MMKTTVIKLYMISLKIFKYCYYGAGNYAGILARQFEHCGITFQGFVVSSNQVVKK